MTFWRTALVLVCLVILTASGCAKRVLVEPAVDTAVYKRIAILPFTTEGSSSDIGTQLADEVTLNLLAQAPDVQIVERTKINVLTLPDNLRNGARSKEEIAIALGQLLEVDAVLTGSVTLSLEYMSSEGWNRRIGYATAVVRLIAIRDGSVVWAKREEVENLEARYTDNTSWRTDYEITQDVIRELAQKIARNFYSHYERH
ncbi:MAG TPA: hypothetical protein VMU02_10090 [bacterium]|nr:hypothetical protein [bacterium]